MMRELFTRLRFLVVRRPKGDLDEELRFHVEQATEANLGAGMTPDEARRRALVDFGGVERTREQCHEQRPGWWLGTVAQDVRYALRGVRRNPAFTITVIATLAVGIGATTAVFSVVDRILFRALPYAHGDRIVSVGLGQPLERQEFTLGGFFFEWRDNQKPFESMTYEMGYGDCNLTENRPIHLHCISVAQNFVPTMGIPLQLGRNFTAEEDLPHGPRVAMITDGLWLSRFNRNPAVVNQQIDIDGHLTRIVGVLPRDFEMPRLQPTDILQPAQVDIAAQHTVNSGIGYPMWAFARLKAGITVAQAKTAMQPLFLHTQQWIPPQLREQFQLQIRSLRDRQMHDAYAAAWVLFGAVLVVLLIACANVASLLSARGSARQRELAVRSALGASRGRLIRQTLTEAFLLAVVGSVAGCVLALILLRIFIAIAPTGVPFLASAHLDPRIVLFAVLVSFLCAALFGIVPALEKPRAIALAGRQTRSSANARLRRVLVAAQIGLSVVLLSGASLLVRSFLNLEQQNLGMETRNVITVHVPLNWEHYPSGFLDFYLRGESALRRLPGVNAVGMSDSLPPAGWNSGKRFSELNVAGKPPTLPGVGGTVVTRKVTPAYFRALQIPIVAGPGFTEEERTSKGRFMILSKELAARLFPGEDPIGQHIGEAQFKPYFSPGPISTVVGVAGNVKNAGLSGDDSPELYELATTSPTPGACIISLCSNPACPSRRFLRSFGPALRRSTQPPRSNSPP